jgi:hypothetical protein
MTKINADFFRLLRQAIPDLPVHTTWMQITMGMDSPPEIHCRFYSTASLEGVQERCRFSLVEIEPQTEAADEPQRVDQPT